MWAQPSGMKVNTTGVPWGKMLASSSGKHGRCREHRKEIRRRPASRWDELLDAPPWGVVWMEESAEHGGRAFFTQSYERSILPLLYGWKKVQNRVAQSSLT